MQRMANLEVQIGANTDDLKKGIAEAEVLIEKLKKDEKVAIKAGLDTTQLKTQINEAKAGLSDLKKSLASAGQSFEKASVSTKGAGNTLTQFSRIAQDAPFGIMGIGNNLTATAEAFASLSKESGGAGNALKAVAGSLLGSGGILLAVSLVTTALTVMAQKGITVGDVFNKLTGTFDEFKKSLQDINKESAKQSGEQISTAKAYVNAAKDINLSMSDRLIAVKKLQDEYPAYFGNLTKEQILNGNVSTAVKELTTALIAKAKASAFAGKIGEIASKKVPLRDKEAELIAKGNDAIAKRKDLETKLATEQFSESTFKAWQRQDAIVKNYVNSLEDVQKELRSLNSEEAKFQNELNGVVEVGIKLDFTKPPKGKVKKELHDQLSQVNGLDPLGLSSLIKPGAFDIAAAFDQQFKGSKTDIFASINERLENSRKGFIDRLRNMATDTKTVLFEWNDVFASGLGSIGDTIGQALANGGNVLQAVGSSLLGSLGALLSAIGDKLITVGITAVIAGTALATMFTPAGIAAGIAAIGIGTALKAGGGFLSGSAQNMNKSNNGSSNSISAGNSVSSPTSSVSNGSSFSNGGTVVFEISGQSLVGVLSNTLNKNIKLGGAMPAI